MLLTAEPKTTVFNGHCGPLKANLGEDGYYRTQYDSTQFRKLVGAFKQLSPTDRTNLLGDQFALFVANRAPLTEYLDLLRQLAGEQNNAVWSDTLSHLTRLDRALVGSPLRPRFAVFAANLLRPEFTRLGWDAKPNEPFLDSLLRPDVIAALGRFRDPAVVAEARRRFDAFAQNPASLQPALREPVLTIVGHTADQVTYDKLRQAGIHATSTEEKLRYFMSMAGATDPALVKQTIAFADAGEVPNGRIVYYLINASQQSEHPDLVYNLVKPMQARLAARMPGEGLERTPMVAAAAGSTNAATAQAVLADPTSQKSAGARIWAARVADSIGTAAELKARTEEQMGAWLLKR